MFAKRLLLAAMIGAGTLGAVALPQTATAATVYVERAPPARREEMVPAPRRGYVWSPGYWALGSNHRHYWVKGVWVRERRGYTYAPNQWVERNGRWELERGRWDRRDNDGDGVPNGRDARPNDPTRR